MGSAVIFYDPIYLEHKTGYGHPERPERLSASMSALHDSGILEKVEVKTPRKAKVEEISLVHDMQYIGEVRRMSESGGGHLDLDTALSSSSYEAALKACGALLDSVDGVLSGEFKSSLCLVRPPGHHALPARGMGFCLFNNIAIAAKYAISKHKVSRVMIVDWDAHHGNGTQEVFYEDNSVLYTSLHQFPHYPGTGWVEEIGRGKGLGKTINFPFPAGTGEEHYIEAFERVIIPAGIKFSPDIVMISAGYDSHTDDLLCSMRLVDGSYRKMTELLLGLAGESASGRLIVTLEGGYDLRAMGRSVVQTAAGLAGFEITPVETEPPTTAYAEKAAEIIAEAERLWLKFSG